MAKQKLTYKALLLFFLSLTTVIRAYASCLVNEASSNLIASSNPADGLVSKADSIYFDKYKYVRVLNPNQEPTATDEDFYKSSQKVTFVVGKSDIDENSSAIRELVDYIIPRMNADSLELQFMMIRGAASPDGPYALNMKLGKDRSASLFNFINSRLLFPAEAGHYSQESVAEDYVDLCRLMRDAKDPYTNEVSAVVDKYIALNDYADLKNELKNLRNGELWRYLNKNYFPQLRAAKVMFFFKKYIPVEKRKVVVPEPAPVVEPVVVEPVVVEPAPVPVSYEEPLDSTLYRRHIIALRTNLLYDFFYMPGYYWAPSPNIQLEYYPKSGHITANFSFTCPYWHWWNRYQFWQIRDYMLEGRYYLKGKGQFMGLYGSVYAHVNKYGLGFSKTKGYEGEGYGAGVMVGYVMNISKNHRWRMEFSLGVGYYETRYDPYVYGNPLSTNEDGLYYYDYTGAASTFKERNHRYRWIGPTNVGIHLTYDLLFRRIQKRGVSFNRSEKYIKEKGGQR